MGLLFQPEEKAWEHIKERFAALVEFDSIRIMQLLEIAQYSMIYLILSFALGSGLEILFPDFDEKKPVHQVVIEVVCQVIAFVVLVFYVRKVAKIVPFLFVMRGVGGKKYRPYEVDEYVGEITIGMVFIASQVHLLKKIDLLSREVYTKYMGLDKRIGAII